MKADTPNFDPIARSYRWLEYLTFGPWLERCRFHFLPELADRRRALILGDGDGRFTARLLAANSEITVEAIDSSAAMLRLLSRRVSRLGPAAKARLQTRQIDARNFIPPTRPYDLVVTHFFLDCLADDDLSTLLESLSPLLASDALWLVSEFAVPNCGPRAILSRIVIGGLYRSFGLLTGLQVRSLPDYATALLRAGFHLRRRKDHLGGLLVSEIWSIAPNFLKQLHRPPRTLNQ